MGAPIGASIFFYFLPKMTFFCSREMLKCIGGEKMEVFYVDVYFLINLCVDAVSLFLTVKLLRIKTTLRRLILTSAIGASVAVIDALFVEKPVFYVLFAVLFFASLAILVNKDITLVRRIRLIIVFLCFEMLLGGIVSYVYQLMDRYLPDIGEYFAAEAANRRALLFSVIILLAIGVLKLFIMLFSEQTSIKSARMKIKVGITELECDAFVDSGNMVRDPMNLNPVVFIKRSIAEKLIPCEILDLCDIDHLDLKLQKRIRLIPVSRGEQTHVMTGFLPDSVRCGEAGHEVAVTLAIDKEEGTYAGYDALIPSSIIEL